MSPIPRSVAPSLWDYGCLSLTPFPRSVAPPSWIAVINTCPAFGSPSLLDVGHSHPASLGRALRDYGHYYLVHGEDDLDPTPFAAHSHSGLGPTPTLLIRHPCTRNKIVRYFEFLSNQRSHNGTYRTTDNPYRRNLRVASVATVGKVSTSSVRI